MPRALEWQGSSCLGIWGIQTVGLVGAPVAQGFWVPRDLGWQGLRLARGFGGRGFGGGQGFAGSCRVVRWEKSWRGRRWRQLLSPSRGGDGGGWRASMNWGSSPRTATSPTLGELRFRPTFSLRGGLTGREKHLWALLSTQPGAGPAAGARPAAEAHVWHSARRRARLRRESAAFYTHLALVEVTAGGGGERLCGCGRLRCCRDVCACGDGDFRAC